MKTTITAVTLILLSCTMFAGSALAFKECRTDQVAKAKSACTERKLSYLGCRASDDGKATAICQKSSGETVEYNLDRVAPIRK